MRTASLLLLTAFASSACPAANVNAADDAKPEKIWVFVGTYTGPMSKGIYRYQMDLTTGNLSDGEVAAEVANPSFLAIHPTRKFLYCVNEGGVIGGSNGALCGTTSQCFQEETGSRQWAVYASPRGG